MSGLEKKFISLFIKNIKYFSNAKVNYQKEISK